MTVPPTKESGIFKSYDEMTPGQRVAFRLGEHKGQAERDEVHILVQDGLKTELKIWRDIAQDLLAMLDGAGQKALVRSYRKRVEAIGETCPE